MPINDNGNHKGSAEIQPQHDSNAYHTGDRREVLYEHATLDAVCGLLERYEQDPKTWRQRFRENAEIIYQRVRPYFDGNNLPAPTVDAIERRLLRFHTEQKRSKDRENKQRLWNATLNSVTPEYRDETLEAKFWAGAVAGEVAGEYVTREVFALPPPKIDWSR